MAPANYQSFELRIAGTWAAGFTVEAFGPRGGSNEVEVNLPWDRTRLETVCSLIAEEAAGKRRGDSGASRVDLEAFGGKLFDAFFPKAVDFEFREAIRHAAPDPLRVRVRIDAPDLVDVPWEVLFDTNEARFLVLSNATPIVRTFNLPTPTRSPIMPAALNVLVMVAGGGGAALSAEQEFDQLVAAVGTGGDVNLVRAPAATLSGLQSALRDGEYHAFHFIGHGRYDDRDGSGELWLEDDAGQPAAVTADELTTHLADHPSMRLVVLNACESAHTSIGDPTSGLAQALFRGGIELVVAMQYEITDENALAFSEELYRLLGRCEPIERAVSEARKSISGPHREWATPVVFMRLADGQLFGEHPAQDPRQEPEAVVSEPSAPVAVEEPPEPKPQTQPEPKPTRRIGALVGGLVALMLVAVVGFVVASGGDDGGDTAASGLADLLTDDSTTAAPSTTAPASDSGGGDVGGEGESVPPGEPAAPPFTGAVEWWTLDTDDCIDPRAALDAGYDGRYWVAPVSCDQLDVELAYYWFFYDSDTSLPTETWPGEDAVIAAADEVCQAALPAADLDATADDIIVLSPIEWEWVEAELLYGICLVPY